MSPTERTYRVLAEGVLLRGEAEIRKAVERATGLTLPERRSELVEAIRRSQHRFAVRTPPDGSEWFYVDDVLVLEFGPTELTQDGGVVTATRKVRHYEAAR